MKVAEIVVPVVLTFSSFFSVSDKQTPETHNEKLSANHN
jgi:hypothetical protein